VFILIEVKLSQVKNETKLTWTSIVSSSSSCAGYCHQLSEHNEVTLARHLSQRGYQDGNAGFGRSNYIMIGTYLWRLNGKKWNDLDQSLGIPIEHLDQIMMIRSNSSVYHVPIWNKIIGYKGFPEEMKLIGYLFDMNNTYYSVGQSKSHSVGQSHGSTLFCQFHSLEDVPCSNSSNWHLLIHLLCVNQTSNQSSHLSNQSDGILVAISLIILLLLFIHIIIIIWVLLLHFCKLSKLFNF